MPSSPRTPQSGQRSSGFDFSFTPMSLHSNDNSPANNSRSRKSSLYSVPSPATPRPVSSHSRTGEFSYSTEFASAGGSGNGLGSLADELAEAWDEDGEVDEGTSGLQVDHEEEGMCNGHENSQPRSSPECHYDRSIGLAISPGLEHKARALQSPTRQTSKPKHRRKATDYSWSDSGDILSHDSSSSSGIPSSLEARLDDMERLAQQGTDLEADEVCKTLSESLRDLSSQANVENGVARLATAHVALTNHLTHQTRLLQTLTSPFLSPLSLPPEPSTVSVLLPLVTSLLLSLPQPSPSPLATLHAFHSSTMDILSTLSYLSDSLHMTRQTTTVAARRLKTAREAVGSMKVEIQAVEDGMRWVERGGWEERLARREAAKFCGEVVRGFEEVCQGWRERLTEQGRRGGVEVGAG